MIRVSNISLPLSFGISNDPDMLARAVCRKLGVKPCDISQVTLMRRAVDARRKSNVHFVATAGVQLVHAPLEQALAQTVGDVRVVDRAEPDAWLQALGHAGTACSIHGNDRPIVVGSGPAGLFCAYALAQAGARPLVIEQGGCLDKRIAATQRFERTGLLDPTTNIQFGEGGAGTFSDGKLTTGISDGAIRTVLGLFVHHGAPEEILWQAKPHIGTDLLPQVTTAIRKSIVGMGGQFLFDTRLVGLAGADGVLEQAEFEHAGQRTAIACRHLVLACGHSARDTYRMLARAGICLEPKPFAIGVRIEHPQHMIDVAQYGPAAGHPALGAADYKLSCHLRNGRSVYSFCMCPGGGVVAAASQPGAVVVNGQSRFARDGANANAALLVNVTTDDFGCLPASVRSARASHDDAPLSPEAHRALTGMEFQEYWERQAFACGGASYRAPAQLVGDFLRGRPSNAAGDVEPSYPLGVSFGDVREAVPSFVAEALREALPLFGRKIKGFDRADAVLTGIETRSSAPVRIVRGHNLQSPSLAGLFPCGEGAGYAGGIMSSAVDGLHCAKAVLAVLS